MEGFKKILYPVSLIEASPQLVPYVKLMAAQFNAEIHLLYVAQKFERYRGVFVQSAVIESFSNELVSGAQKRLQEFKQKNFSDFPETKIAVLSGDRSKQILGYIESSGIDLVVMGVQTDVIDKVMFGSVAEKVIKLSPVPVLVVKPPQAG